MFYDSGFLDFIYSSVDSFIYICCFSNLTPAVLGCFNSHHLKDLYPMPIPTKIT